MSNATQALGLLQTTRCPPSLSLHRWWLCHLQNTHPLWDIKYIKIQQYIYKIYRYSISKRSIGLIISPRNSLKPCRLRPSCDPLCKVPSKYWAIRNKQTMTRITLIAIAIIVAKPMKYADLKPATWPTKPNCHCFEWKTQWLDNTASLFYTMNLGAKDHGAGDMGTGVRDCWWWYDWLHGHWLRNSILLDLSAW